MMTNIIFSISCLFICILAIKIILYPYFVAKHRNHNNKIPVLLVSFIPVIGFFVSLAWAFSNDIDKNNNRKLTDKQIIVRGIKLLLFTLIAVIIACFTGVDFINSIINFMS